MPDMKAGPGVGIPSAPCRAQFLNGKSPFLFLLSFNSKLSEEYFTVSFFGALPP